MKFNFCHVCGAPSKDELVNSFNQDTGEQDAISVCSKNPCHTGHDERAQPLFARGDWKCNRCGVTGHWFGGL